MAKASDLQFIDSHVHFLPEHEGAFVGSLEGMGLAGVWNIAYTGNTKEPYGPSPEAEVAALLDATRKTAPGKVHTFFWPAWQEFGDRAFPKRCAEQVARLAALGIAGVKVWKDFGLGIKDPAGKLAMLDDARLNPVWEVMIARRLILIAHVADPADFWGPLDETNPAYETLKRYPEWHFGKPGLPSREELFEARDALHRRFPELVIVNCHFGGYATNCAQLSAWMDAMPNFHATFNPGHVKKDDAGFAALVAKHGRRLMFETDLGMHRGRPADLPWNADFYAKALAASRELFAPLGPAALENYARRNAERLIRRVAP